MKAIKLSKTVTASNDLDANEVRAFLKEKGIFLVNLLSAAGSGKTTMLLRLVSDLRGNANIAVMVADLAAAKRQYPDLTFDRTTLEEIMLFYVNQGKKVWQ